MSRNTELAWAAGFFDGEGCTTQCRWSPTIYVSQNDREVLDRFQAAVGLGKVRGPYRRSKSSYKPESPRYIFHTSGATTAEVLKLLWPFLSRVKKEQAIKVFEGSTRKYSHSPRVQYRSAFLGWVA